MATAELPAWPPLVMTNSEACTFMPASGNLSTRMTMSCTAPPAQSILGADFAGSVKFDLALYPGADDVMRDRHRRRRGQAVGVLAQQHGHDLVFAKPPGVFEFRA